MAARHSAAPRAALALVAASLQAPAASAQTVSVANTSLGKVASGASGATTLTFSALDGGVTAAGGAAQRVSAGLVRFPVSIPCRANSCDKKNMTVTVASTGTPSGRLEALGAFTIYPQSNISIVSGPTGSNPVSFTIGPIGNGNTGVFYVGADVQVDGDDSGKATGAAATQMQVSAADFKGNATVAGAALTATVFRSMSLSQSAALNFGVIVRPLNGSGQVTLAAADGSLSVQGAAALGAPAPSRGMFTVTGEGGQSISVTVPASFVMGNGAGGSITVTTNSLGSGGQTLSNTLGSAGSFSFYVGGSFPIDSTTPRGVYTGLYSVNAQYN